MNDQPDTLAQDIDTVLSKTKPPSKMFTVRLDRKDIEYLQSQYDDTLANIIRDACEMYAKTEIKL